MCDFVELGKERRSGDSCSRKYYSRKNNDRLRTRIIVRDSSAISIGALLPWSGSHCLFRLTHSPCFRLWRMTHWVTTRFVPLRLRSFHSSHFVARGLRKRTRTAGVIPASRTARISAPPLRKSHWLVFRALRTPG